MSSASPTWSPWPWVITMWVAPFVAVARSPPKAGLPVKKGSISTTLSENSRRKAEWPNQVILIVALLAGVVVPGRGLMPRPAMIVDAGDFAGLPRHARLLGADLGTKTIGLALSDVERRIATPLETIKRTKFTPDAQRIRSLAERFGVGGLVLGLPLNMDGSEGPRSQATRAFARNLAPLLGLPIAFWDERLSTSAVTRALIAADTSRARRAAL